MLTVLAASGVLLALTVYWVARSLISGSASIKKLIETIDYNVHTSVDMLQRSISDINAITQRAGDQMEHVESIVSVRAAGGARRPRVDASDRGNSGAGAD